MKFVLALLMGIFTNSAFADIKVVVDGRTYQCDGDSKPSQSCAATARLFGDSLESCMANYNGPYEKATACINQLWPRFKQEKSACVYEGSLACSRTCIKYYSGPYEKTSACNSACN